MDVIRCDVMSGCGRCNHIAVSVTMSVQNETEMGSFESSLLLEKDENNIFGVWDTVLSLGQFCSV